MKTIAYVDGYNLYYGRLRHSSYKWLDLQALIASIVRAQAPASELVGVKLYTSMIKEALSRKGRESVNAQDAYHRAIRLRGVEVEMGRFTLEEGTAPVRVAGQQPDRDKRVDVWTLGEKQTDVKLALGLYRDAMARRCDQVVLVTNDSDLAPTLQALREDREDVRIGVVLPRRPSVAGKGRQSGALENLANWTRHHILDDELASSQLPVRVPTRKRPIDKPGHW